MTIRLHCGDLPDLSRYTGVVAVETETMGLEPSRDRLCVVQLSGRPRQKAVERGLAAQMARSARI